MFEQGDVEVGERRARRRLDVTSALELPVAAADEQDRQVQRDVAVALAHAGAVEDGDVIEQRAVAVGRLLHLLDEVREQRTW